MAMAREGMGGSWLEYSLAESLSLDQARWLTKTFLLPRPDRLVRHLLREALAKILGQEQSSESDLEILIPLALRIDDLEEMRFASRLDLITFLKRNPASRRRLFLDGLRSDPQREKHGSWGWSHALEGEDTRWLMDLIRQREGSPPWLWETLYYISRSGCSSRLRRQVRQEIGANHPDLLQHLDREARKWGRDKRSLRQKDSQKEHITYSLEPLVRELLQDPDAELHQKMVLISRWCFVEPRERPTNLEGRWKDLPADLQEDVLRLCREALEKCEPTPREPRACWQVSAGAPGSLREGRFHSAR